MVVGIVLVVMVLHSLPYLGARFPVPAMAGMRVRVTDGAGGGSSGRSSCCGCLILRRRDRILLLMLLLLMMMLLLLLLLRLLRFVVSRRTRRSHLLIRRGGLSPFAIPVHGVHLRERLERIAGGIGRVRRWMGRMWRRRTVTTVVSGWCAWRRCAPHQHGLPRCLVAIHLGLHVLDLRRQHAVGRAGHWRAAGGIAGRRTALQWMPASSAHHVHIGRRWMHRGRTRYGTGGVGWTTDAAGVSRLHVAVFGWLAATELLAVKLLLCLTGQLMSLVRRQWHVDEAIIRGASVILWIVWAQRPVLE